MNCCANCFSDEQIKKIIVDNGHIGDCDFCGEKQRSEEHTSELQSH